MAVPYLDYLQWAGYAVAGVGIWRFLPLAVIRLVAAFTHNEQRHKQCMEVLRLTRRDASSIPTYVSDANAPPSRPNRLTNNAASPANDGSD
jgi:hypothetical protein